MYNRMGFLCAGNQLHTAWCLQLKIEIVNVVATAALGSVVSLSELAKIPDVSYNPSRYFCAYFKDESMESKVSIFTTGKMIGVRAKSEKVTRRDLQHVVQFLSDRGLVRRTRPKVTVQNIVVTVDLGTAINLEELQDLVPGFVYEPEQFPAGVFRPMCHEVSVLAFASGKLVIAGLKSESTIEQTIRAVLEEMGLTPSE